MIARLLSAAAFAATALSGAAGAATYSIIEASGSCAGAAGTAGCPSDPSRDALSNVNIGTGDGAFYSLGLGGSATFEFDRLYWGSLSVFEVTYNSRRNYMETADVFLGRGGTFTSAGSIDNQGAVGLSTLDFAGGFDAVRFVDTTPFMSDSASARRGDGFDIDAISVESSVIPLPASVLLLGGALAGLGAWRRRRIA